MTHLRNVWGSCRDLTASCCCLLQKCTQRMLCSDPQLHTCGQHWGLHMARHGLTKHSPTAVAFCASQCFFLGDQPATREWLSCVECACACRTGTATAHVIRTLHGVPAPKTTAHAVQLGLPAAAATQGLGAPSLEPVTEDACNDGDEHQPMRVSDGADSNADADLVGSHAHLT